MPEPTKDEIARIEAEAMENRFFIEFFKKYEQEEDLEKSKAIVAELMSNLENITYKMNGIEKMTDFQPPKYAMMKIVKGIKSVIEQYILAKATDKEKSADSIIQHLWSMIKGFYVDCTIPQNIYDIVSQNETARLKIKELEDKIKKFKAVKLAWQCVDCGVTFAEPDEKDNEPGVQLCPACGSANIKR